MSSASETKPPWVIQLDDLDEGFTDLQFAVQAGDLDVDDEFLNFAQPLSADVTIARTLQTFSVKGQLQGTVEGECSRCLSRAQAKVQTDFRLFIQRKEAEADELEAVADEDGILVVDPGVREVSLVSTLRDALVLELPQRLHCRQDCRGLCSTCGADLNQGACDCSQEHVDPRWAALSNLKSGSD